jgi:hypothetical protein
MPVSVPIVKEARSDLPHKALSVLYPSEEAIIAAVVSATGVFIQQITVSPYKAL